MSLEERIPIHWFIFQMWSLAGAGDMLKLWARNSWLVPIWVPGTQLLKLSVAVSQGVH